MGIYFVQSFNTECWKKAVSFFLKIVECFFKNLFRQLALLNFLFSWFFHRVERRLLRITGVVLYSIFYISFSLYLILFLLYFLYGSWFSLRYLILFMVLEFLKIIVPKASDNWKFFVLWNNNFQCIIS